MKKTFAAILLTITAIILFGCYQSTDAPALVDETNSPVRNDQKNEGNVKSLDFGIIPEDWELDTNISNDERKDYKIMKTEPDLQFALASFSLKAIPTDVFSDTQEGLKRFNQENGWTYNIKSFEKVTIGDYTVVKAKVSNPEDVSNSYVEFLIDISGHLDIHGLVFGPEELLEEHIPHWEKAIESLYLVF